MGVMTNAEARARWLEVHDELLRGVTHALSNRVATMSAAAYMLEYDDVTGAQAAASLRVETERMDAMLQLLRLLPSRDDREFEPVSPHDVVTQAVGLHAQHCDLRDVRVAVTVSDTVLPVWVEPHALLQALLLALTSAKRSAFAASGDVTLHVDGDADEVRLLVHPGPSHALADALAERDVAAADGCLHSALGTAVARADGGCMLTLPTLPAARRAGR
jgi:signal transduction histidine kinase